MSYEKEPKKLSKGEYFWLASGICLEECNGERALGLPPFADPLATTDADMPAAAKYGDGLLPLLLKKEAELKKLGLPDTLYDIEVLKEALRHYSITVAAFVKANKAAHEGNSAQFKQHWLEGRRSDFVADALFDTYGLRLCASD